MDNNRQSNQFQAQPISDTPQGGLAPKAPRKRVPLWGWLAGVAAVIAILCGVAGFLYAQALQPVNPHNKTPVTVEIVSGMTPEQIADTLQEKSLIRSSFAFMVHTRLSRIQNKLQAGTYTFNEALSTKEIAAELTKGPKDDEFEVTFLPGATELENKKVLLKAGFSEAEIDQAFSARYSHPLFEGRPETADLEGYLYGETHRFTKGTSLNKVLERFFDDFYELVQKDNLVQAYKKQGLSLYQGITLASIIQRESGGDDEAQIAQVFFLRLKRDIPLGSDVTYQYIADKLGVPRDVNINNPYNTRRFAGLTPGPISTPGKKALQAVAAPAPGDYLFFLSGDDGRTYFAHTDQEHEANKRKYCQQKCQIL